MKNEFEEKVAHLSTPLFPFTRVSAEELASWLRSKNVTTLILF